MSKNLFKSRSTTHNIHFFFLLPHLHFSLDMILTADAPAAIVCCCRLGWGGPVGWFFCLAGFLWFFGSLVVFVIVLNQIILIKSDYFDSI